MESQFYFPRLEGDVEFFRLGKCSGSCGRSRGIGCRGIVVGVGIGIVVGVVGEDFVFTGVPD